MVITAFSMCKCEEKLVLTMMTDDAARRYQDIHKTPVYQGQCTTCGALFVVLLQIKTACSDLLPFALATKRREDKRKSASKKRQLDETNDVLQVEQDGGASDKTVVEE